MERVHLPKQATELIWRTLDDELVIVRPSDGQIRVLNQLGAFIWQAVNGDRSIADLADLVCAEYEVSPEEAQTDVVEFLQQLADEGMILWQSG